MLVSSISYIDSINADSAKTVRTVNSNKTVKVNGFGQIQNKELAVQSNKSFASKLLESVMSVFSSNNGKQEVSGFSKFA